MLAVQPKVKTHQLPSRAQIANIKPTKMDKAKEKLLQKDMENDRGTVKEKGRREEKDNETDKDMEGRKGDGEGGPSL